MTLRQAQGANNRAVGILFYRAQYAAGNTAYVEALADAVDAAGGIGVPIFAASLRDAPADLLERAGHPGRADHHGAGRRRHPAGHRVGRRRGRGLGRPGAGRAGHPDPAGTVPDQPTRAWWAESDEGMSPLDVATQVAVPEFDGRLITVPFSFKETDADGLPHYVPDPERCRRVAEIAVNHARLRHIPPAERKIAIVLSAYPTKHARIGNAVGLDTPGVGDPAAPGHAGSGLRPRGPRARSPARARCRRSRARSPTPRPATP